MRFARKSLKILKKSLKFTVKKVDYNGILIYNIKVIKTKRGDNMKDNIHPEYKTVTVQCACGTTFTTGSTKNVDVIKVDICSKCHPFFTGKQKLVDTGGRVDKFKKRYGI